MDQVFAILAKHQMNGDIEGTKNTSITLIELVNEELDCNMEFLQIVTLGKKRKIFVINLENFLF